MPGSVLIRVIIYLTDQTNFTSHRVVRSGTHAIPFRRRCRLESALFCILQDLLGTFASRRRKTRTRREVEYYENQKPKPLPDRWTEDRLE